MFVILVRFWGGGGGDETVLVRSGGVAGRGCCGVVAQRVIMCKCERINEEPVQSARKERKRASTK